MKKDSHLVVPNSGNYILFTFTSSLSFWSARFCQALEYFPWHCYYTNFSQHSDKMNWHVRSGSQTFQSREKHPLQNQPFQKTASSYQDRCLSPSLLTELSARVGSVLTASLLLYCCDLSGLHVILSNELLLVFAEIFAMLSFSDWDHSEIWPCPSQLW